MRFMSLPSFRRRWAKAPWRWKITTALWPLRPDHADALSNRGNALLALNRCEEALASYDRALAVRPDFAEALSNRGHALERADRLDAALASYDRALAVRPDFVDALYNRGNVLQSVEAI